MMEKESNLVMATLTFSWCFVWIASRSSQSWDSSAPCSSWIWSTSLARPGGSTAGAVPYPTDRMDKAGLGRQMGKMGEGLSERKRVEIVFVAADRWSGWGDTR